jgi:hypothetical protein
MTQTPSAGRGSELRTRLPLYFAIGRMCPAPNWAAAIVVWLTAATCLPLAAQDVPLPRSPEKPSAEKTPFAEKAVPAEAGEPRRVEEVEPSLYYLKDKQGNLQPVPNFPYETFIELYKIKHQLVQGDQRPRYSLQQMLATGAVNAAGQAELTIQFRIKVNEDQWTRIPLRMDHAVLRETAQYQGSGEHFLDFEGDGDGYVAWFRGTAGQQHQLTLKMLVPLTVTGQETRLRLLTPRFTESELKFKVPFAKAMARVSEGATLQTPGGGPKETEFTVDGLNGDFELSWHPSDAVAGKSAALEATGNISAHLDARGVETEATFTVRSYGEAFNRFRIRLPPEATLVPGSPSGYTLTEIGPAATGLGRQRVVEVQFARRTVGPVEVRINTKRTVEHPGATTGRSDTWLELAGFEIPEAARHWGTIAVTVAGDWQVLWGASRGVRQIDQLPEVLRRKDATAGFEYFAQPSSLLARLVPRRTRIGVEPVYVFLVDSDQVRLDARLKYTVRGAKVPAVDIAMPDWQIDEVSPDSVVAIDGVPTGESGPLLTLPLVTPTIGQFEIRLKAHRLLPPSTKALTLALPQPQASAPAAAVVAVQPADNVEIVPDSQAINGLLRQQIAVPLDIPVQQQEPLFYRSDTPKAMFAAELRRREQKITAAVNSRVNMEPGGGRIEQRFSYTIAYKPADYVVLEVPNELTAKGRLVLTCDEHALTPIPLNQDGDEGATPARMRVALPKTTIGFCEIVARYSIPLAASQGGDIHVPLIMPLGADVTSNLATVTPSVEQHLEIVPGVWTAVEGGLSQSATPRSRDLTASQRTAEIVLKLVADSGGDAAVVVDRALIQTCVAPQAAGSPSAAVLARQDQVVLQLTTRRHELQITLPEGADRDEATVLLNGLAIRPRGQGDRNLTVPLSSDAEPPRYVLSLQYHFSGQRGSRGPMAFEFPSLGDDTWIRRAYWQLLLPADEHLVVSPRNMTSEFTWGWNRFYFGRQPVLGQADLENWAWGNVRHPGSAPLPAGMNVYLFSSLGRFESCEIVTAGRSTIVFVASGIALLMGLILIYVRAARHPVVLLAAAALLAALAAIYPELAMLAAQASAVGLALALFAAFLRHLTAGRAQPQPAESSTTLAAVLPLPRPGESTPPAAASKGSSPVTILPLPPEAAT